MSFTPKFNIGQAFQIKNYIPSFSAQNTSGIRRSKATNTLVIICNHTKSLYDDKWYGNILHYAGQGRKAINHYNSPKTAHSPNQIKMVLTEKLYFFMGQKQ